MQTRQRIADKLKNAQVSDEKGIKSLTQLWMARVVVGAKQLNMLPSEYYSRFMEGEIRRGEVPDDDSSQLYSEKDDAFWWFVKRTSCVVGVFGVTIKTTARSIS